MYFNSTQRVYHDPFGKRINHSILTVGYTFQTTLLRTRGELNEGKQVL